MHQLTDNFPLTLAQQDIFFDQIRRPNNPLYNVGGYIDLTQIEVKRLQQAHAQLVQNEQAFGIRIHRSNEQVVQYVTQERTAELPLIDFSSDANAEQAADLWLQQKFETAMTVEDAELFEAALLQLPEQRFRYVVLAHHLILDGWGFSNLSERLSLLYNGAELEDGIERQWSAVAWQDDAYVQSDKYQADKAFWLAQPDLDRAGLIDAFDAIAAQGRSERLVVELSRESCERINQLCRDLHCSAAHFYLALVSLYCHLMYETPSVRVGLPVHNRRKRSERTMLGVFSGINPMVVDCTQATSFASWIQALARQQKQALRHQRLPIGHINAALERSADMGPPFDVTFNYLAVNAELDFAGTTGALVYLSHNHEPQPLKFNLWAYPKSGTAQWQIDYSLACFSKAQAQQLSERLMALLAQVLANPELAPSQYQRLPHKQMAALSQWPAPQPAKPSVMQRFEHTVERFGQALAAQDGKGEVSYQQLNAKANRLAGYLIAKGVGPGVKVGIYLDRSIATLVAVLGIAKAGGAYVPLDKSYPQARLSYMVDNSSLGAILCDQTLPDFIQSDNAYRIDTLLEQPLQPQEQSNIAHPHTSPNDLMYVIYTSGSTGKPKGVEVTRGNVDALLQWAVATFDETALAKMLFSTSLNFDISVFEMFAPLCVGGQCLVVSDILELTQRALEPSFINTVPSAAALMLEQQCLPSSARTIALAGEPLSRTLVNQLLALPSVAKVYNLYGPSEDTVYSTFKAFDEPCRNTPTIGQPVGGSFAYVVSEGGQLQPEGMVGELYLTGAGVARGYCDAAELTAERFIDDPFNPENPYKVYKTGDLVRRLDNGELAYIGRNDQQVKIRGFRVELGEIESLLCECDGVKQAAVVALQGEATNDRLNGFVVADEQGTIDIHSLLAHLQQKVPHYMVPGDIAVLDALPMTLSGKIDKKALGATQVTSEQVKPLHSETEQQLALLWADLLSIPLQSIGADAHFFKLGGHSLQAVRLLTRVNESFSADLLLEDVFHMTSLAAMAEVIDKRRGHGSEQHIAVGSYHHNDEPIALSFAQQSLWHLHQQGADAGAYNMVAAFDVAGVLDIPLLQQAFETIVERHEVLRTTYHSAQFDYAGERQSVRQNIEKPAPVHVLVLDYQALEPSSQHQQLQLALKRFADSRFDLQRDVMLKLCFAKLAPTQGVLMVNLHHIAADGWSVEVIVNELVELYQALSQARAAQLPSLPLQYADYACWQREALQSSRHSAQLDYWRGQLEGIPVLHSLDVDYPRCADGQSQLAQIDTEVAPQTYQGLSELAKAHRMTPFMLVHGILNLVLARNSNTNDMVIGTFVANRLDEKMAHLVGFFVNALVLRCQTQFDRLDQYLSHIRQTHIDAQLNQSVPFERLVELSGVPRSNAYAPLFQIAIAEQPKLKNAFSLGQATLSRRELNQSQAKYDLNLLVGDAEGKLTIGWQYNAKLFDAQTIESLQSQFNHVLAQLVKGQALAMAEIALLDATQYQSELERINGPLLDCPATTIDQLFTQQAKQHAEQLAVVSTEGQISYGELAQLAGTLATLIGNKGLEHNQVIGIYTERSIDTIVAMLGVLQAGMTFMVMDPQNPSERLGYMVKDADCRLILSTKALQSSAPIEAGCVVLALDELSYGAGAQNTECQRQSTGLQNAYLIYTSGSTGKPKGVMCHHQGLINLLYDFHRKRPLAAGDNGAVWANFGFDVAVYEIFSALCFGATLHIVPQAIRALPQPLLQWLSEYRIHSTFLPAFVLPELLTQLRQSPFALKRLLVGVEPIAHQLLWDLNQGLEGATIINGYGPSETTVCSSLYVVGADTRPDADAVTPIGTAVANTSLWVLDSQRQLSPPGVCGELYIGGDGVTNGYIQQPQLTAERFIDNPFEHPHKRLYRSGDLVRWDQNRQLVFVGRADDQVKIRGFRVEPGEVANLLKAEPLVQEAVVLVKGEGANKHLAAFVVCEDKYHCVQGQNDEQLHEQNQRSRALKQALKAQLPDFMVPASIVFLAKLPMLSNDKVDKKALAALAPERRVAGTAPSSTTEQQLYRLWTALLAIDDFGIEDNFFELGGNSLLLAQLVHGAAERFDLQLTPKELLNHPTIAELAAYLDGRGGNNPDYDITVSDEQHIGPLSASQMRVWLVEQLKAGSSENHIAGGIKMEGQVSLKAIRDTLDKLIERHQALRTRVDMVDGAPVQVVMPAQSCPLQFDDLSEVDSTAQLARAAQAVERHAKQVFDLNQAPLMSALVVKLSPFMWRLHFSFHHLVFDGWSVSLFVNDFIQCYQACVLKLGLDEQVGLSANAPSYLDYARWQQRFETSQSAKVQKDFWQHYLDDCQLLNLGRAVSQDKRFMSKRLDINAWLAPELLSALDALAKRHHSTLFSVLVSAAGLVLARRSGMVDFNMGIASAGRHLGGCEKLVGNFVNNLPLRVRLQAQQSFAQVLRAQTRNIEQVLAHQDLPSETIAHSAGLSAAALFNVFFNYLSLPGSSLNNDFFSAEFDVEPQIEAKFGLSFYVKHHDNGLALTCQFDNGRFDLQEIEHIALSIKRLLLEVSRNSSANWQDYRLDDGAQAQRTIAQLGCAEAPTWRGPVYADFARYSEQPAVVDKQVSLSYGELDAQSNTLAALLVQKGVMPGQVVAIEANRCAGVVVAMLAVLKAAARFVMVDDKLTATMLGEQVRLCQPVCQIRFGRMAPKVLGHITTLQYERSFAQHLKFEAHNVVADEGAYLAFTSGSDGTPKAVLGTHASLNAYAGATAERFGFDGNSRFAMMSGLTHDPLLRDIFLPLAIGAAIYVPDEQAMMPGDAHTWLNQQQINCVNLTPSLAQFLFAGQLAPVFSMTTVMFGGEPLSAEVLNLAHQLAPKAQLVNLYGATETGRALGIGVCHLPDAPQAQADLSAQGVADVQLLVLNDNMTLCGEGEVGQIAFSARFMPQGYFNDERLSEQKFVANPWAAQAKLYLSGDLGRVMADGTIAFVGRRDSQFKRRGYRIEPAQIENALLKLTEMAITQAKVVFDGKRLFAFVVADALDNARVMDALRKQLAAFLLPDAIKTIAQMPLNKNGKIDTRALLALAQTDNDREIVAPSTDVERQVHQLWQQLLGRADISREDNFFDIGGHSLLVTQFITRIEQIYRVRLNYRRVFDDARLVSIARLIDQQRLVGKVSGNSTGTTRKKRVSI